MENSPQIAPHRRWLLVLARTRILWFIAFAASLVISTAILQFGEWNPLGRVLIALIPLLPMAAIIATYTVLIRRRCFDEFGRRVLLEGCATVFIAGMPLLILYGTLRNADIGLAPLDWQGVFIAAAVLWGVGMVVSLKRHQGYINFTSRVREGQQP